MNGNNHKRILLIVVPIVIFALLIGSILVAYFNRETHTDDNNENEKNATIENEIASNNKYDFIISVCFFLLTKLLVLCLD